MKTAAERTQALLTVFPMDSSPEAPRALEAMFETMDEFEGSPGGLKMALMQVARREGKQTLKDAWGIAAAFLELITDDRYLELVND